MANSFDHLELNTGDEKKAKEFYKKIFKWKFEAMKGMPYTMIDTGSKNSGAGMQLKMKDAPTQWLPYVQVDDVKKTLDKAQKAGAKIVVETMPIPMGEIAVFIDPTGAALGIWAQAKKPAKKTAKKAAKKKSK